MVRRFKGATGVVGAFVFLVGAVACGGGGGGRGDGGADVCTFTDVDTDGDFINDCDEGRGVDPEPNADADTWPDWLDRDSDGDLLTDAEEAGDTDLATPPVDTDGDGVPDYLDDDSDGDGVLDINESAADTDGDGIPDFRDTDADGDTILDIQEGAIDSDGDGIPNALDLDSDGDGVPDSIEAGDADLATAPVDTDGDGSPDFLDLDSDGDYVLDSVEDPNGNGIVDGPCLNPAAGTCESSRIVVDTDGDGTPDLIERIAGVDPGDATSNIPAGDFFFVLPFEDPALKASFDFSTNVRRADIFISMDTTGSFGQEIDAVAQSLDSVIIPGVQAAIPDTAFGVGRYEDFPLDPFGLPGDLPYELLTPITTDAAAIAAGVAALPPAAGGLDDPEAGMEALFQWASGAGFPDFGYPAFGGEGIGGVEFRVDSLPIIIQIGDARSHLPSEYNSPIFGSFAAAAHSRDDVVAAMNAIEARVIGVNSLENAGNAFDPGAEFEDLALATSAFVPPDGSGTCATGLAGALEPAVVDPTLGSVCPLVFDVRPDGTGLDAAIVDAITQLASFGVLDISTQLTGFDVDALGHPLPAGFTTDQLVTAVTAVGSNPPGATITNNVFIGVTPGTSVTFEVTAENTILPPATFDYVMEVEVRVMGDAVTLLDTRRVYIVVPRDVGQVVIP